MNLLNLLLFVLWSHVEGGFELHRHYHRQINRPDLKNHFRPLKDKGSSFPSAGDGALNPWLYRFPPWSDHNPSPPSLALTNGEAFKQQNLRDLSNLRRAPHEQDRFVFYDVKVDLDLPYVKEVVKTVLANQERDLDHLVFGEDEANRISFNEPVRYQNDLLHSYKDSSSDPRYPNRESFIDRKSPEIVFHRTNDNFPLYEVYSKENLNPKSPDKETFSILGVNLPHTLKEVSFSPYEVDNQVLSVNDNLINPKMVFPEASRSPKDLGKNLQPKRLEELAITPRGLNPRYSSLLKDGVKYPESIQDIINGPTTIYSKESNAQVDPRHNRPSRMARQQDASRSKGGKWIWTNESKI